MPIYTQGNNCLYSIQIGKKMSHYNADAITGIVREYIKKRYDELSNIADHYQKKADTYNQQSEKGLHSRKKCKQYESMIREIRQNIHDDFHHLVDECSVYCQHILNSYQTESVDADTALCKKSGKIEGTFSDHSIVEFSADIFIILHVDRYDCYQSKIRNRRVEVEVDIEDKIGDVIGKKQCYILLIPEELSQFILARDVLFLDASSKGYLPSYTQYVSPDVKPRDQRAKSPNRISAEVTPPSPHHHSNPINLSIQNKRAKGEGWSVFGFIGSMFARAGKNMDDTTDSKIYLIKVENSKPCSFNHEEDGTRLSPRSANIAI